MKLENVHVGYLSAWPAGPGIYVGKGHQWTGFKNSPRPRKITEEVLCAAANCIIKHGPLMVLSNYLVNQGPAYLAVLRKDELTPAMFKEDHLRLAEGVHLDLDRRMSLYS